MLDLVGMARWKGDRRLARGELYTSERFLAGRWNRSRGWVADFLAEQEAAGRIKRERQPGRKPSRITILVYDDYSPRAAAKRTANEAAKEAANETANETEVVEGIEGDRRNIFPTDVGEAVRRGNGSRPKSVPFDPLPDDPDSWEEERWNGRASRAVVDVIFRKAWMGDEPPSRAPVADWTVGHELRRIGKLWREEGGEAVWYLLHGAREAADRDEVPGVEPGEPFTLGAVLRDPEIRSIAIHRGRCLAAEASRVDPRLESLIAGVADSFDRGDR